MFLLDGSFQPCILLSGVWIKVCRFSRNEAAEQNKSTHTHTRERTRTHANDHAHARTITRTNNRKSYEKKRKTITNYDIISIVILTLFSQLRWLLLMQCPFVSDFLPYSLTDSPIPYHTFTVHIS